jgi:NAD(P)-dependent dehydrogenase (short-subunit alcohol dehydrogenase family)
MTPIEGSVVLVTGGQRGLGKALVSEFLARGARTVYATARQPAASDDPRIIPLALDVNDDESVRAAAASAGDVTIVVNNAGAQQRSALLEVSIEDAKELFETNVFGALRVAQRFAPILAGNGGGALVDIASALTWAAGAGIYGATKAALWSLTNSLRLELASQRTLVVGVHLGYTETDMTAALDVVKNDPRDVAAQVVAAIAEGRTEVLADDVSRRLKAAVAGPVEGLGFRVVDGDVLLTGEPDLVPAGAPSVPCIKAR